MDYKFLLVFFGLSMVNVVFATIKSLVTINGSPAVASLVSGGYFAFYNIVLIYFTPKRIFCQSHFKVFLLFL